MQTKNINFHFEKVTNLSGFAAENAKGVNTIKVLTRALLTSDDPNFHIYSEQISNVFLNKIQISPNDVYQFLVIIHEDLSADLYINNFQVALEVRTKREVKQGEIITQSDIADIGKVRFPHITITEMDKVIYCFKISWRFGLFFDLSPRVQPADTPHFIPTEKLDVEEMSSSIGELYRYLSFYHVYKVLESDSQFEEMMNDGWFPFTEIIAGEYKKLSETYQNKFDFENKIKHFVNEFNDERIKKLTNKWWKNEIFNNKKALIEAGINAYLQNTSEGFVNCIKNLCTEMEGILRELYLTETGKGNNVNSNELINYIIEKAKNKTGSGYSLLLPIPFLKYLQNAVFSNFNIESGNVDMSRNTSSHGVAKPEQYTKDRALQLILILDQIYFYS
ncbi:MAG: hypothetical protein HQ536_02030 [Parcubacteria group bacterium]|nr:hypothetical protein [Parcubacteria group bacterium]